ncbi:MAG: hypothetical protein ACT4O4_13040 [Nitrospiraceae bacterium]
MPGRSDHQSATREPHPLPCLFSSWSPVFLVGALFITSPALAEVRVVTAQGEYRMGDRDTREDAVRLATESAKRSALEQVATYLESVTVVDGMDVTKDEIRTYTAGLVLVLDQQTRTTLDGDTIVVTVDLVAQIDTEEVGQAIAALRENEDARVQLAALKQENEQLQQDLDVANRALTDASTADQAQQATQQRQDILNRVQSNMMVSQAWTEWVLVGPIVYTYPWLGPAQTHALLNAARGLYPASPHVVVAERVFTSGQPPATPQPPAPGSSSPHMSPHGIVPAPGLQRGPRTLKEITHTTPTAPPHVSHQPGSRNLTDVHQLNPFLPPSAGQQQPGATTRMQQFLQQNGGVWRSPGSGLRPSNPGFVPRGVPGGQPPVAGRLPPTINQIHPPMPHQVPRTPFQMAPRSFGGGGHPGGGAGPGIGGGRGGAGGGGGGGRGGGRGR